MEPKSYRRGVVIATAILGFFILANRSFSQIPAYEVPLFQYAVFYNVDMDVSPGSAMTFSGPVFCNGDIWCYPGGQMTFDGPVEASGNYFFHWDTNGDQSANIANPSREPIFDDGPPISGVAQSAFFANGSADFESLLALPPAEVRAPQQIAYFSTNHAYFYNEASLIISNASYGMTGIAPWSNSFAVYLQDNTFAPTFTESNLVGWHWVQLTNDFYVVSNSYLGARTLFLTNYVPNFQFTNNLLSIRWTNNPTGTNTVWYAGFSFLTNTAFYDYRESATAQVVQVDVGKLGEWITSTAPNGGASWNQDLWEDVAAGINSIYVYNGVPFIGRLQFPAVSLVNGQQLPRSTNFLFRTTSGLTVVTPQPLYVIGNYNVQLADGAGPVLGSHNMTQTYPAALMADAITVLSSNWPVNWGHASYISRPAANTTINAACLTGIVASMGGQNDGGTGVNAHYSGGLENYFRLLENWAVAGCTFTYNGSMTAMFQSVYATNYWQLPDEYYGIPTRNWAFDTNFLNLADLPPLTPNIINSNSAPTLAAQPSNESVVVGQTTNFIVSATGVPGVTYQWIFGGTNIPGATNDVLLFSDVGLTDAGNYAVKVSNVLGSIISSNVLLSVYTSAIPMISAFSFSANGGAEFSVSGVPGFNYTVEASTNLIDWVPLVSGSSPFIFADTNADFPQRFYRGVYAP